MKPVRWRLRARRDAAEAAAWYAARGGQPLELDFVDAMQAAEALIAQFPGSGSCRHAVAMDEALPLLRFHRLKRFDRYLVYYFDHPTHVEVLRIWDSARGLAALMDPSENPPTPEESP